jgi:uncharacterized protein YndB with AHSA1/START domain
MANQAMKKQIFFYAIALVVVVLMTAPIVFASHSTIKKSIKMHNQDTTKNMVITRIFHVSAEKLFNAWADGELVKKWWGPRGFTAPVANMNFKEGNASLVAMRTPEGLDMYNLWYYIKIVPNREIEFVQYWSNKNRQRITAADAGLPPVLPNEVRHVITFKSMEEHKTQITITEYGYSSDEIVKISKAGMGECLDKMAEALGTTQE